MEFFSRYCADIGFRREGCSVRLGMQIAFGRGHRKTAPTA